MSIFLITKEEVETQYLEFVTEDKYQDAIMYCLETSISINCTILHVHGLRPSEQLIKTRAATYSYCRDERLYTFRLIGKPALGPSPPVSVYLTSNNSGSLENRQGKHN